MGRKWLHDSKGKAFLALNFTNSVFLWRFGYFWQHFSMIPAVCIAVVVVGFIAYFLIVIRIRGRKERAKERAKGLDPIRYLAHSIQALQKSWLAECLTFSCFILLFMVPSQFSCSCPSISLPSLLIAFDGISRKKTTKSSQEQLSGQRCATISLLDENIFPKKHGMQSESVDLTSQSGSLKRILPWDAPLIVTVDA